MTDHDLITAVDAAFAATGRGMVPWPDPDRRPDDGEYSRLTDAGKWRIIGARADAWITALGDAGLAAAEREAAVDWMRPPGTVVSRTDRVVPFAAGALPLVIARSQLGSVADPG